MALEDYVTTGLYGATAGGATPPMYNPANLPSATGVVQNSLSAMLDPNSAYIKNARRQGAQLAAQRGGINSSISAGAAERAAIDAAAPLAQQAVNIQQNREQQLADDWASQQNFNRAMMGQYAQTTFNTSLDMLKFFQQAALEDPELYTPEVTSGMSNFFQRNLNDILGRYFNNGR